MKIKNGFDYDYYRSLEFILIVTAVANVANTIANSNINININFSTSKKQSKPRTIRNKPRITREKYRNVNKKADTHNVPDTAEPNSMVVIRNIHREINTLRFYGKNRKPYKDIDYRHQDNGTHPFPHVHRWYWNSDGSRSRVYKGGYPK